jgi:hypothetical protein
LNDCCPTHSSPSCSCACCSCRPFPRSQSLRLDSIPLSQLHHPSKLRKGLPPQPSLPEVEPGPLRRSSTRRRVRRHPLIPSKTVVDPPGRSDFSFLDNKKSNSVACLTDARLICKEKLLQSVPNKLCSTGVRIFFFCDMQETETHKTGTLNLSFIILYYSLATIRSTLI